MQTQKATNLIIGWDGGELNYDRRTNDPDKKVGGFHTETAQFGPNRRREPRCSLQPQHDRGRPEYGQCIRLGTMRAPDNPRSASDALRGVQNARAARDPVRSPSDDPHDASVNLRANPTIRVTRMTPFVAS